MWSTTPTSNYVTTIAESILSNTMSELEKYASLKSIKLYASSKVSMGKEVEEINSVIGYMEKNDSKGVYIHDDVSVNKKLSTYQFGEESSETFKSAYMPEFF
eukprot:558892-Ditylum_brightwellii.AAC.1